VRRVEGYREMLDWLLEDDAPAVKHAALRDLVGLPANDPKVKRARAAAMRTGPIATILDHQEPDGYWVKPGAGYLPKYTATAWQAVFLDQLGADGSDRRVRKACEYVLEHAQTSSGGFGAVATGGRAPPPSTAIHCLNGNLVRALVGFGMVEDERVERAIDWQARSITGERFERYYAGGACGPEFCCSANGKQPCAWGAVKAMGALARIPPKKRAPHVRRAVNQGVEFLLSRDPAKADYPMGYGNKRPSGSWFKPGFPSGYVTDVLQNLEVLSELGFGKDPRLHNGVEWVLSKRSEDGRWRNEYAYNGKIWTDIEKQGAPSKWVTLRACRVLKAAGI